MDPDRILRNAALSMARAHLTEGVHCSEVENVVLDYLVTGGMEQGRARIEAADVVRQAVAGRTGVAGGGVFLL
jgi:hypothetical protein